MYQKAQYLRFILFPPMCLHRLLTVNGTVFAYKGGEVKSSLTYPFLHRELQYIDLKLVTHVK